jgi:hypothetical protein
MYEVGLEPNLHLPAPHSRMGRSRQTAYKGKPPRETVNDRKLLDQAREAVFINHASVCMSRALDKPKYYLSLRNTLSP